ncbi:MAG: hypothetical protein ACM3KR_06990 [Deltaproteobacteria bacterium]
MKEKGKKMKKVVGALIIWSFMALIATQDNGALLRWADSYHRHGAFFAVLLLFVIGTTLYAWLFDAE